MTQSNYGKKINSKKVYFDVYLIKDLCEVVRMDDHAVLEAITKNENKRVLRTLYASCLPDIAKYIKMNGGSQEEADDCFQESIIALIATVKAGKFNTQYTIHAFLFGVARNKWLNEVRRKKRTTTMEEMKEVPHYEELKITDDTQQNLLLSLMKTLGGNCADLLKMVIYDTMNHKEIMVALDMRSTDVVKTSYYRCMKRLRERVASSTQLQQLLRGE